MGTIMVNLKLLWLIGLFIISNAYKGASIQCGNPGWAFNGYIKPNRAVYQVGDKVHYGCSPGFTRFGGNNKGTCLSSGTWDLPPTLCGLDYAYRKPVIIDSEFPTETSTTYKSLLSDHDPLTCVDFDLRVDHFLKGRVDQIENKNFGFKFHLESIENDEQLTSSPQFKLGVVISDSKDKSFRGNIMGSKGEPASNLFIALWDLSDWDFILLTGNWIESNSTLRLCDVELTTHPKKDGNYSRCGPLPQPLNGLWTSNSTDLVHNHQQFFNEGFKADFKCSFGFYLIGNSKTECRYGEWTFKTSSQQPLCLPFEPRCPHPGDPSYGRTVPRKEVYEVNEMVEYECGPGNVTTLYSQGHCQSDGSWDLLPSACGANLAYRSQPFSTISGKDMITKIKFHPELVDGNVSTCIDLDDWTKERWFMWADLNMSRNGDIRLRFDQAVNSDIVLTLDGEKDIISYKTGMELSFWIYNLTQSTNSLRFLLLNYLIPLRLCEIFIVYDANDTYQCGNPPSSLGGRYHLSSSYNRVDYECLSSKNRLIGPSSISCEHGKWKSNSPVCLEVPGDFDSSVVDDYSNNEQSGSGSADSSESFHNYSANLTTTLVTGTAILILVLVIGLLHLFRSRFAINSSTKSKDESEIGVTKKDKECGPPSIETMIKTVQPSTLSFDSHHYELDPTVKVTVAGSRVNRKAASSNTPVAHINNKTDYEELFENVYEELIDLPIQRCDQQIGIYNHLQ